MMVQGILFPVFVLVGLTFLLLFSYRLASQLVFRAENFIGAVSTLTEQSKDRNDTRCPAVRSH